MSAIILIVTGERDKFTPLATALKERIDLNIHWAESGSTALATAGNISPLLAIIDEMLPDMSGLDFARQLLEVNALIYTALASGLSSEDFHETSEGLGVLVQLPVSPGAGDADDIVGGLKRVFAIPPDPT